MKNKQEDSEYISQSSIDNPPTGKDRPLIENQDSELIAGERIFEIDLSLTLKPEGGKPVRIPLATGKLRGLIVESVLEHALSDRHNRTVIRAVLDNPSQRESVQASIFDKKELF